MCLLVFGWNVHPEYRLILSANRDEFHARPTQELHPWPDQPGLYAGRDLQAGGTWLGVHNSGRFATVTNYREHPVAPRQAKSRGGLVTDFVCRTTAAGEYAASIKGNEHSGFNLLSSDGSELAYTSNRGDQPVVLDDGVYGLSNASLDTPWPKLLRTKASLAELLNSGNVNETSLMRLMVDRKPAAVADVANEHLPFELARALTAPFIVTPDYGTRCTSTVLWGHDGRITISERRFDADGNTIGNERFSFTTTSD